MSSGASTSAGSRFLIGTTATSESGDTFTDVGEITNISEFGRQYNVIQHKALQRRNTQKFKGSYDEGDITLQLAFASADPGQIKARQALLSDADFNCRVLLADGAIGSPSAPSTFKFKGKVSSFRTNPAGVDNIVTATILVAISGDITEVAAV